MLSTVEAIKSAFYRSAIKDAVEKKESSSSSSRIIIIKEYNCKIKINLLAASLEMIHWLA
jgi:hypothetical protein